MTTINRYDTELRVNNSQYIRGFKESERAAKTFAKNTTRAIRSVQLQLGATLGGVLGTRQVLDYADAYTEVTNKLRQVTSGTHDLAQANRSVFNIATDTRSNLEAVATLYSRTARVADKLGLSQQDVATFTRAVNQSFKAYGATAQEATSATIQLSQALGKGALNGDEFRTIAEAAPPIMAAIAKEAGVAVGALKDMGAAGEISADLIVKAILNAEGAFDDAFGETTATVRSNLEVAASAAKKLAGESQALRVVLTAAGEGAIALANNMDVVGDVMTGVAIVIAGRLLGPLVLSTAAFIAQVPATLAATRNMIGLAAAVSGYSKATVIATVATASFSRTLGLLGGPAGIAIVAGLSLLAFVGDAESAAERMKRVREEAAEFNDQFALFGTLRGSQTGARHAANVLDDVRGRLEEQKAEVKRLETAWLELQDKQARRGQIGFGVEGKGLRDARAELIDLQAETEAAEARFKDLEGRLATLSLGAIPDQRGDAILNKALQTRINKLKEEEKLYGVSGRAAKLRYDIEAGAFKDATATQLKEALRLAEELDKLDTRKKQTKEQDDAARKLQDSFRARIDSFQREITLYGDVTNVAKLRYEQEAGFLKGLTDQQIAQATRLAGELDALEQLDRDKEEAQRRQDELAAEAQQATNIVNIQEAKFKRLAQLAAESQATSTGVEEIRLAVSLEELREEQKRILAIKELTNAQKLQLEADFETARQNLILISEGRITEIKKTDAEKQAANEERVQKARIQGQRAVLDAVIGFTKEDSKIQRAALALKAVLALREARIALAKARAEAVAAGPFPKNLPALTQVAVIAAEVIGTLSSLRGGGQAHGGLDYVPNDQTFFLKRGERIVKPEQNRDLTKFLENGGNGAGGRIKVNVAVYTQGGNQFTADVNQRDGELFVRVAEIARAAVGNDLQQRKGVYGDFKQVFDVRDAV